jgi:hypothetical protein
VPSQDVGEGSSDLLSRHQDMRVSRIFSFAFWSCSKFSILLHTQCLYFLEITESSPCFSDFEIKKYSCSVSGSDCVQSNASSDTPYVRVGKIILMILGNLP